MTIGEESSYLPARLSLALYSYEMNTHELKNSLHEYREYLDAEFGHLFYDAAREVSNRWLDEAFQLEKDYEKLVKRASALEARNQMLTEKLNAQELRKRAVKIPYIRKSPDARPTAVYALVHCGYVVYVGQTILGRIRIREAEHRRLGKVFDGLRMLTITTHDEAIKAEDALIHRLHPPLNKKCLFDCYYYAHGDMLDRSLFAGPTEIKG